MEHALFQLAKGYHMGIDRNEPTKKAPERSRF
jgi:hypothetical protein